MRSERVTAVILDGHKGPAFEVPFDPAERWRVAQVKLWPGRRGYRVRGTVNKIRFESAAVGRSRRFFVLVTDEMTKTAKLRIGSKVEVSLVPAPEDPA